MPVVKVPISRLVEDSSVYPRKSVSASNIASLVEAVQAGETLPPLVADAERYTVVDGVHRLRTYQRLFGADYEVEVDLRTYANDAARLEDAIALNVGRGADLSRWDLLHCADLADQVGLPLDRLAKVAKWQSDRLATYRDSRRGQTLDDRRLALKRSIRHKIRDRLTPEQEQANEHLSGMSPLFHVNQLVTLLETDLMPTGDPTLAARLSHLADLIVAWPGLQQAGLEEGA